MRWGAGIQSANVDSGELKNIYFSGCNTIWYKKLNIEIFQVHDK